KSNGGVATFTNSNSSYSGVTSVTGGVLATMSLGNGNSNSSIGAASPAASNIVLDGGTLRYVGRNSTSTNRLFSIGAGGGTIEALGFGATSGDGMYGAIRFTNPGALDM